MSENTGEQQEKRGEGRRFSKGQSGNPGGRPKGARNRTTLAVESLLQGEAEAITRTAIELAKSGDTVALRLILERVVPVRRGKPVCFDLPLIEKAEDVSTALGAILMAMARGELTPDEAATIAGILETKRKAIETVEIETRLATLEQVARGQAR